MFSALSQGSPIYILDKTSTPRYEVGEIIGVSYPKTNPYNITPQNTVDLKIKIGEDVQEFNSIPSINSVVTYNGGKIVISETKQGIQNEVESILQNSRQILDNIDQYQTNISECESILKKINPQFALDMERDERLTSLESRFDGVESKLDKIFNLISKK